jgi:hypothetical protein
MNNARARAIKPKTALWLSIGAGLLLLAAANVHLVYVSITSQPDCVAHLRQGESPVASGQLRAAQSACKPQ